ncbi:MAG TPA: carbohydrate kinase family protein [Candidatus Paceibacterota bacterium]|nr:carbohydrate kinase family protein [Candidatus Paceibacterota bacterium]
MAHYDFVSIGDITTDAFIELEDVRVDCDSNNENCRLSMNFGDKIPYKSVTEVRAVGNSPNAAVAAHRLGLATALISDIGDDRGGQDCLDQLRTEGLSTEFVKVHQGKITNYHYVLRYQAERTILIKHEEYPYALPSFSEAPGWLYLSSMGPSSLPFHDEIAAFLDVNPDTKLAFQPGTFQMEMGKERMAKMYAHAELTICNKEESQRILGSASDDITELLVGMHALGSRQVVITDGPNGGYASDGTHAWAIPMYPDPAPPVDRTGAGDATASTTAAYLAHGLSLPEALKRGMVNSMSVVQHIGAQEGLLSAEQIDDYLAKAPADFAATPLA